MSDIEPKIIEHIKKVLMTFDDKYMDNEKIKRNILINDLDKYDADLMAALLSDSLIRDTYTEKIADVEIFKVNQFIEMLEYKDYLEDSYTKFKNKIGLTAGGKFIGESSDVVLDFPFKDCVLKASMSREDMDDTDEVFLNEVIAKSEIDELFDPKILVNTKKFDKEGEHEVTEFCDDDNLVIKGNNLIALHSIKKRYAGKVKLIFIDPPYNTGNDSFKYNDRFNHSSWLTFMKNRLEIARDLLSEDGVILIQISFHNYPYLRILADEIFGKDNHIFDMNTLVRHPERNLTADKDFNDVIEYTLMYSKRSTFQMPKKKKRKTVDKYVYDIKLAEVPNEILNLGNKKVEVYLPQNYVIKKREADQSLLHRETVRGSIREKNSSGRFYVANLEPLSSDYPYQTLFKVGGIGDDGLGYRYFELPKKGNKNGAYYQGMPQSSNYTYTPYPNFVDYVSDYNSVNKEGIYEYRNGKKPENYIKFYIDLFTSPNDLILDFFMGSATTQAVAMKMNRHFIGIEQMDYINEVSVPRLQKVIAGEQGGISKDVNWQGGGSFVYAELMEKNTGYLKEIINAKEDRELDKIFNRMKEFGDLDFRIDLEKFAEEKSQLSLDEQKEMLIKIIDKNQLYYNYSEIDDEDVRDLLLDNDYQFNKSFYGGAK